MAEVERCSRRCTRLPEPHLNIRVFDYGHVNATLSLSLSQCLALANDDRDIDLYHWSSARFSAIWLDTLSVLVARGRAQVSVPVAAAVTDWPKRIRDMRYVDHEDCGGID